MTPLFVPGLVGDQLILGLQQQRERPAGGQIEGRGQADNAPPITATS